MNKFTVTAFREDGSIYESSDFTGDNASAEADDYILSGAEHFQGYTIQKVDFSAQETQAELNDQSQAYLDETDWYVIRKSEVGTDIPADVVTARAAARAAVVRPLPAFVIMPLPTPQADASQAST